MSYTQEQTEQLLNVKSSLITDIENLADTSDTVSFISAEDFDILNKYLDLLERIDLLIKRNGYPVDQGECIIPLSEVPKSFFGRFRK